MTNTATPTEIAETFGAQCDASNPPPNLTRYNIAPTQRAFVVRVHAANRELAIMYWGLVPHWAKDRGAAYKMINARAETIAQKPAFRDAFRKRRCLVPATGFYEWQKFADGKRPHLIRKRGGVLFAFAGLWEQWCPTESGDVIETFTIVTTEANNRIRRLHDRMPVILGPEQIETWMNPASTEAELLTTLRPCPDDWIETIPVSPIVNNARNDSPDCLRVASDG